jgi:hypothetical protein
MSRMWACLRHYLTRRWGTVAAWAIFSGMCMWYYRRGGRSRLLAVLDHLYSWSGRIGGAPLFFRAGEGDLDVLATCQVGLQQPYACDTVHVTFASTWVRDGDLWLLDGQFPSPTTHVLPNAAKCQIVPFQLVLPCVIGEPVPDCTDVAAICRLLGSRSIAIHLAATGDVDFQRRRDFFACQLASKGIISILMMAPFYGPRCRPEQKGPALEYLSDLLAQGYAAVWCERMRDRERGRIRVLAHLSSCGLCLNAFLLLNPGRHWLLQVG